MATASRRRRSRPAAATKRVPTKKATKVNNQAPQTHQSKDQRKHRLHPDDPRLKLSMRAFHPVLDKSKRRPRYSFSSSQSSHSSESPTLSTIAPIAPITSYMAFPPSTFPYAELYDPCSPWGVKGIKYDPCSPWAGNTAVPALQFPTSDASTSDSASLHSSPSPPPGPPRERIQLQFYQPQGETEAARISSQDENDTTNHGLASDIVNMFKTQRHSERREGKKISYCFVLADTIPTPTSGPEAFEAAKPALSNNIEESPLARPAKATAKKAQPAKKTPVPTPAAACRCHPQVPSTVHMYIDSSISDPKKIKSTMGMLKQQFSGILPLLCPTHREKYERMEAASASGTATFSARPFVSSSTSPPQPRPSPSARPPPELMNPPVHPTTPSPAISTISAAPIAPMELGHPAAVARPYPNIVRDNIYRHDMLREIANRFSVIESTNEYTHGDVSDRVVYDLLNVAVHPQPVVNGQGDAYFLSGDEAYELLDKCSPTEPVVTQNEQTFRWRPRMRPIEELFRRMENLDRKVSVQVPSRRCTDDSFESRDLTEVRGRFLDRTKINKDPWNILDLRSPLPAAVLPQFLTSENCQLLPRLRDEVLNPSRAERDSASREQWNEWRDVLEWVLLSEGGHNTSPHTDSHGLATWITVQEGLFGFGWMSQPTPEERQQWMDDPQGFKGGRWCFMILEPGQTVFFNSGTVHFVFRQHGQATLALGGHILQWSGIERWLAIVGAQMKNPHITNEDMEWSAPKYVRVVARLVAMRLQQGKHDEKDDKDTHTQEVSRIEAMGGGAVVKHLLEKLKEFDDEYLRPRPKGKHKKKRR